MWPNGFLDIISRGSRDEPCLYLTFDDGPDPDYTPRLLDILAACGVSAGFFLVGARCLRYAGLARRIAQEGHALGNHCYSHPHPWAIGAGRAKEEVKQGYAVITGTCGRPPRFFRPPYGRLRKAMLDEARATGSRTILWSRSAVDWGGFGTPAGVARRLAKAAAGDILLLHDAAGIKNRPAATLRLLPDFIARCRERGLEFESIDRLAPADHTLFTSAGAVTGSAPDPSSLAGSRKALINETRTAAR